MHALDMQFHDSVVCSNLGPVCFYLLRYADENHEQEGDPPFTVTVLDKDQGTARIHVKSDVHLKEKQYDLLLTAIRCLSGESSEDNDETESES